MQKTSKFQRRAFLALALALVFSLVAVGAAFGQAKEQPKEQPKEQVKLVGDKLGLPGKLGEAVAKTPAGKGPGQIDPSAPRGAFGIPGAPDISWILAFCWALWVGWIFSTVGAFGGIMAGVGHITVYGLGDYAKTFAKTSPALNKTLTDSIRTSNQFLVGLSGLISTINYLRSKRLAWPLGIALALGSIAGAVFIPILTGGKISFRQYQGWFGVFVFVVGAVLLYELTPRGQAGKKAAKQAAQAFEKAVKEKKDVTAQGIRVGRFGLTRMTFTFFGVGIQLQPHLGLCGRSCHRGHLFLHRRWRRFPLRAIPDVPCRGPHVRCGRHLGHGSAREHADQHHRLHHGCEGRHGLGSYRNPAGRGLHRIHDRAENPEIYPGQVVEDHLHHPGPLCRTRVLQPGILRTEMGTDVKRISQGFGFAHPLLSGEGMGTTTY